MRKENIKFYLAVTCCGVLTVGVLFQGVTTHREKEGMALALQEKGDVIEELKEQVEALEKQLQYEERNLDLIAGWDNPISEYCSQIDARSTYDMSTAAAFSREAWKRELDHLIDTIREKWETRTEIEIDEQWLTEYESRLDRYRQTVEEEAEIISGIISDEWEIGWRGSMASISVPNSQAEVYRSATLHLLDTFAGPHEWEKVYTYHFDETVVSELREYFHDPSNVAGIQMFPPISEALGGDGQ